MQFASLVAAEGRTAGKESGMGDVPIPLSLCTVSNARLTVVSCASNGAYVIVSREAGRFWRRVARPALRRSA